MRVLQTGAGFPDRASHPSIAATAKSVAVTDAQRLQSSAAKKNKQTARPRNCARGARHIYSGGIRKCLYSLKYNGNYDLHRVYALLIGQSRVYHLAMHSRRVYRLVMIS